ncbi:MAG: aminomethyltransferase [Actinomycetota bacterium]
MAPFGGWDMPLEFSSTLAEHGACRSAAAVFDVSHLGTVRLAADLGADAVARTLTNDIGRIGPGRAQYTHLLDDDGSVADDIIVWWRPDGVIDVMPNASNTDRVRAALGGTDVTSERAVLAVQGPEARALLARISPAAAAVGRFRVDVVEIGGAACVVAGTGYTGEDGVEIAVPTPHAERLWSELVAVGVLPAGLGARDLLRLEAGLPLHGSELGPGITPLQAGLGWVVSFDRPFKGREALIAERDAGPARRLRGIVTAGRRPPRAGSGVLLGDRPVGTVTSGNFSPTLGHGIAMALLPAEVADDDLVAVDVRGSRLSGRVVPLPFLRR